VPVLAELAESTPLRFLPVDGSAGEILRREHPFLTVDIIPEGTYGDSGAVVTVGIGTYWLVLDELGDELAYSITKALWHTATRKLLDQGGLLGRRIRLEHALLGLPIPVHDGALRYYTETRDQGETAGGSN
jgi:hypothetical protein